MKLKRILLCTMAAGLLIIFPIRTTDAYAHTHTWGSWSITDYDENFDEWGKCYVRYICSERECTGCGSIDTKESYYQLEHTYKNNVCTRCGFGNLRRLIPTP